MRNGLKAALAGLALLATPVAALVLATPDASAQRTATPEEWDGLQRVQSTRFSSAFLAPGADFSTFTKVMLDPTEVSFRRNWQRDWNSGRRGTSGRISDAEAVRILETAQSGFQDIFTQAYQTAGQTVVTTPGPDVMRIRTYIINLDIAAPDTGGAARSRTYTSQAGAGSLVVEARDSMSGALLARGVDNRRIGDSAWMVSRTSVSNRADFGRAFRTWAQMSVDATAALKAMPPIAVAQN
jgi:hypothetical protein